MAHPNQQVNMTAYPKAFSFADLVNATAKPILSLSTFSLIQQPEHDETVRTIQQIGRSNLRAINARRYIDRLGECSSDWQTIIGNCTNQTNSHRCMGQKGGIPDLVAWDLVEAFHTVLSA